LKQEPDDFVLRKTKHVVLLSTPETKLTWEVWKQISNGTPSIESKGQWKVWSAAHDSSTNAFNEFACYINVTSVAAEYDDLLTSSESDVSKTIKSCHHTYDRFTDFGILLNLQKYKTTHHASHTCEGVNHVTISKVAKGSTNYKRLLAWIQASGTCVVGVLDEFRRIQSWLGRRFDDANYDSHQRNLARHHPGTGEWLFRDNRFRDWASLDKPFPILWLVGPGGCGKSVLCSFITERMRQNVQQQATIYVMLTCDKPRSEYHIITQLALQLLDYVVEHRGGIDAEVFLMLPREQDQDKKMIQVCELIKVLISQCPAVFVFVDGLDEVNLAVEDERQPHKKAKLECVKRSLRSVLLFLASLTSMNEGKQVRLWCSSKQTNVIDDWMRELAAVEVPVDKTAVSTDIADYLEHHFKRLDRSSSSASRHNGTVEHLCKTAKNNFLLASGMVDQIAQSNLSADHLTEAFMLNIPISISELYKKQLDRLRYSISSPKHHLHKVPSRIL
jgi:Cdc6-like AAA superfamily ATPase